MPAMPGLFLLMDLMLAGACVRVLAAVEDRCLGTVKGKGLLFLCSVWIVGKELEQG